MGGYHLLFYHDLNALLTRGAHQRTVYGTCFFLLKCWVLLYDSKKYPYHPMEGIGFSRRGGRVNLLNFPVGRCGVRHRQIFPEGSRDT